ncbi:hypothetical protein [Agrobacterium vaccinii]|uniref:hypothetical protein n=1 Tax=Agrobacterium vaccinii TaxID=2735528 RepID=UPI001E381801|nr:hypothetical protein [Agrobacterium vaccinii]
MRVKLKVLNKVKKKLSDGTLPTYYYAWKGGARLPGIPGDQEFMAAYHAAIGKKVEPKAGTLQSVLTGFQQSFKWDELAPRTQSDYVELIKIIEKEFGTFPLSALSDRRSRSIFIEWRDVRAKKSQRQADYGWQVLARILSWAYERGLTLSSHCEMGGRLYRGSRA